MMIKMIKIKKLAPFIIISSALMIVFFIVNQNPNTEKSINPAAASTSAVNSFLQFQRQPTNSIKNLNNSMVNFTEAITQMKFQKLTEDNPDILSNLLTNNNIENQIQTINNLPNLIATTSLNQQQLTNLMNQFTNFRLFQKDDLRMIIDDSPENNMNYLLALIKNNQSRFADINDNILTMIDQWMIGKSQQLQRYVALIPEQINDLLNLPTPVGFVDFHLKNINLWQKKFRVYNALITLDQDPIKSLIAIQYIKSLIAETAELDDFLRQKLDALIEIQN